MTWLPTIDPCACSNAQLSITKMPRETEDHSEHFYVWCNCCETAGLADPYRGGAVDNWNAGERGKRADW